MQVFLNIYPKILVSHLRGDVHTHFVTENVNLTFQVGEWVGKNIFIVTFGVTKWFRRRSKFKRKSIINKYKKLVYTRLFSISSRQLLGRYLYLTGFVISLWKKAPTSHIYSSQHVENGREENYLLSGHSSRNHILTTQIYLQVPADLFMFTEDILKKTSLFMQCPCQ